MGDKFTVVGVRELYIYNREGAENLGGSIYIRTRGYMLSVVGGGCT